MDGDWLRRGVSSNDELASDGLPSESLSCFVDWKADLTMPATTSKTQASALAPSLRRRGASPKKQPSPQSIKPAGGCVFRQCGL